MAEMEDNVNCVKLRRSCTSWSMFEGFEEHVAELISLMSITPCPGKEVFLRELIFFSTTRLEVKEGERMNDDSAHNGEELCINVLFNGEKDRLTVEDNGAEMTDDYLGTRPKQGTKALISALKAGKDLSSIKLFDVGFFTVFAVADKVTIDSTHSGRTVLYTWESSATGRGFSVKCTPSEQLECRTQIILDLKKDVSENIKRIGLERFLRQHNCRSSYKINVYQYSVINSSEEGCSEPEKEAVNARKDVRKGAENTPGTSEGRKNSNKLASKTKASSPTTTLAGLGPSLEKLLATPLPSSTQISNAIEWSTPLRTGQMPPGIVSPTSQAPARAGVSQGTSGPPSGRSSSTVSPVLTQRFDALKGGSPYGAGQKPSGIVSPASQGPLRAGVSPGSVKTNSLVNQRKGTKRKSTGPSDHHETPKSRKSSVNSDVSVITPVGTDEKQNHVGKGIDTPFSDCTNFYSKTPKTPGSVKTPLSSKKFISALASVKDRIGDNATIAVKVLKQTEPGKEKPEADGKAWHRGSWEIVDSTERAILKVYGPQDMKFFQPRRHLLLDNVWIKEDHIAFTILCKVEEYKGEIKTVEGIDRRRRSDEAKKRMTLADIKNIGCKAAARVHISQIGDVHPYKKRDGAKTFLKKLQVKDQRNSRETYELVTFHNVAGMQFEVHKRYLFHCITYNRVKGNFQTVGQTLPQLV